jgi:hypothetical protein
LERVWEITDKEEDTDTITDDTEDGIITTDIATIPRVQYNSELTTTDIEKREANTIGRI